MATLLKNETALVSYHNKKGRRLFLLTARSDREWFYLYRVGPSGELTKLGKARDPPALEKTYGVLAQMRK